MSKKLKKIYEDRKIDDKRSISGHPGREMFARKDILIVCALEQETHHDQKGVGQLWAPSGIDNYFEDERQILYTGVGKVNATFKLTQRLHSSHLRLSPFLRNHHLPPMPKIVINYGTAGSRELPIGELVDCTRFIQRDMDATSVGFLKGQTPFDDDILSTGGKVGGPYGGLLGPTNQGMMIDFRDKPLNPDYGSEHPINTIKKHCICGSGDNFVDDIENEIDIIDVFDMEAYALAKVCYYYKVPFISFKYITDNANEHSPKDWKDNLENGIIEFIERVLESETMGKIK